MQMSRITHWLLFVSIFSLALILRIAGIAWDANAHLHPDERFLTMVTTDVSWPASLAQYFDTKTSPLNPHNVGHSFYVYGTYPVYITKYIAQIVNVHAYDGIQFVGRALSALIDLCVLLFVYGIARTIASRLYPNTAHQTTFALSSMLLYTVTIVPIQQAHFFTVDPYATLFSVIVLSRLIRHKIDVLTGIAFGLALSAKISAALLSPLIVITFVYLYLYYPNKEKNIYRKHLLLNGIFFILATLSTLRIAYPYLFDGWTVNTRVLENWKELKSFDGPLTAFPPAYQWISVPVWQPALDLVTWGLGYSVSFFVLIGAVFIISKSIQSMRRNRLQIHSPDMFLLLTWSLLLLGYMSIQFARAMRYLYPIYPALAIIGGYAITELCIRIKIPRVQWIFGILTTLLLFILPLSFLSIYITPHTRITASTWIYEHIEPGKTIAWEHWDDPLPLSIAPYTISQYATIQLPMYDPDSDEKWQHLSAQLANTDYIVLSSNRVYGGTQRAASRFPITHKYYQLLFSGALGFERVYEGVSRPHLSIPGLHLCLRPPGLTYGDISHTTGPCNQYGLTFIDDYAEESFTVYDHPKVSIFSNTKHYSQEQLLKLLSTDP